MYIRLKTFITYNNILGEAQNGFREGRSTESAIQTSLDKIFEALDTKIMPIGIFLDLSKAYDVINHKILLTKLEDYGFRGVVNKRLQSYLTGRRQCVEVKYKGNKGIILDNVKSDLKQIHSGVPQGSISGPVLFLLYINDLTRHILDAEVVLFADDTNILIQAEDENGIQLKINRTMNTLYNWFYTNGLVINTEKPVAMSFHS
jgi:retron-type reverse transcriptase